VPVGKIASPDDYASMKQGNTKASSRLRVFYDGGATSFLQRLSILCYNIPMESCLFCKIVAREIPSTIVYEDDAVFAFLDIHPVNIGHVLIVPKAHHANLYETPDETIAHMMVVAKKHSIAVKSALNADGINIEMNNDGPAGQIIFHTHLHIIPRFEGDGFTHWHGAREYNEGEADEVALKIQNSY